MPPMSAAPRNTRSRNTPRSAAQRRVPGDVATRLGQGLDDEERDGDEHDARRRCASTTKMPRQSMTREQLRADDRREHGREAVDEREARQHAHERLAAEQVAHDRHGDDAAGGGADALQHAEHAEPHDVGRERGGDAMPRCAAPWRG